MPLTLLAQAELNGPFIRDPEKREIIARYRGAFTKVLGHPMEMLSTEEVYEIAIAVAEAELRANRNAA